VKIGHYRATPPPGAEVALAAMLRDPMAEPPYRWRVPYVIVCGTNTSRLIDLAVSPNEVLKRGSPHHINSMYYITKCVLPALERVLGLCGIDVKDWFTGLKKRKLRVRHLVYENPREASSKNPHSYFGRWLADPKSSKSLKQKSMDIFTLRGSCECCGEESTKALCQNCLADPLNSLTTLQTQLVEDVKDNRTYEETCAECASFNQSSAFYMSGEIIGPGCCTATDCTVLYRRSRLILRIEDTSLALSEVDQYIDVSW
jgi:DNA polymerase zeta